MAAKKKMKTKSIRKKARGKNNTVNLRNNGKSTRSRTRKAAKKRLRKDIVTDVLPVVTRPTMNPVVQSGDLQGLSRTEGADSESVDELIEEGNAFEADAVDGVENAKDADTAEVTTREVPEDDVPAEYLDRDDVA